MANAAPLLWPAQGELDFATEFAATFNSSVLLTWGLGRLPKHSEMTGQVSFRREPRGTAPAFPPAGVGAVLLSPSDQCGWGPKQADFLVFTTSCVQIRPAGSPVLPPSFPPFLLRQCWGWNPLPHTHWPGALPLSHTQS